MLALTYLQGLMAFLFCLVCVLLIVLILIQKGKGGGLSGAFGGVGSYSPFGTKTGDALTWATVVLTGMFLLIAVFSNYVFKPAQVDIPGQQSVLIDNGEATQPAEEAAAPTGEAAPVVDPAEAPPAPIGDVSVPPVAPAQPGTIVDEDAVPPLAPAAPAAPQTPAGE